MLRTLIRCVATFAGAEQGMATLMRFHAERRRCVEHMSRQREEQSDSAKLLRQWTSVSLQNAANFGMIDYYVEKCHDAGVQIGTRLLADVYATGATLSPSAVGRISPLVENTPNFQWHDALRLFVGQLRVLDGPPSKIPFTCVHALLEPQ